MTLPNQQLAAALAKTPRPSKYRNTPVVVDGIRFASKREAKLWGELKLLERANLLTDLQRQVRFDLFVNGIKICTYVADFTYRTERGCFVVLDAKGVKTPIFKIKAKLVKSCLGIDVVCV